MLELRRFAHQYQTITGWMIPLGYLVVGFMVGWLVSRLLVPRLRQIAFATPWRGDGAIVRAIGQFPTLWCVLIGAYFAVRHLPMTLPPTVVHWLSNAVFVVAAISATVVASRIAVSATHYAAERSGTGRTSATIFDSIVKLVVVGVGILLTLQSLGIAITPILTALGVGGLAVALALQDTLSNLFAGFQILASQHVRPGDYVQLSSGEEGYVRDITWRITTIEALTKVTSVVPNSKLAGAIVSNYYQPTTEIAILIPLGVAFDSDLEKVERVTNEVAKEVMLTVEGGVPEWEPVVRYNNFDSKEAAITFNAVLRTREFGEQFLVRHEFIKRLQRRYQAEGIRIPYPVQTVRLAPTLEDNETKL
ncbi:MAG: mechanosensitive ion channel family protein [Fibrella sp.]|nr:mechanosensitive ion channel family protein [Armatimonadota bacterium]